MNRTDYNSPLDSWFRRQGSSSRQSHHVYTNQTTTKLPRIRESIEFEPVNRRNNHRYTSQITSNMNSDNNKSRVNNRQRSKTPNASFFYQKCIDEVSSSNHPSDLELSVPRELAYVRSIPTMKYITYGTGNCNDSVWQLEISA